MSPRYGGPVTVLESLVRAQVTLGHTVSIATTNADYPTGTLPVPVNEPVQEAGVSTTYFSVDFRPLNISFAMARQLPRLIADHDIIDIHGLYRFPPTFGAWQARRQAKPYIIRPFGSLDPFLHARSSKSRALKLIYEQLFDLPNLRAADAVCFNSDEERDRTSYLGLTIPSIVVPNGLDWKPYEILPPPGNFRIRVGLDQNVPIILFLGRINFKKGLDILIPAFAKLKPAAPRAKLLIVGPDNNGYTVKVREMVAAHQLDDDVIIVDMLTGAAVREAYRDASIFVLSSYTENFGMTVIESLACGTPVVISDQVNIHREVERSGGGIVTPCEADKLSAAMLDLLNNADRRKIMGSLGRSWVRDQYDWPHIVDQLDREYEKIIARRRVAAL